MKIDDKPINKSETKLNVQKWENGEVISIDHLNTRGIYVAENTISQHPYELAGNSAFDRKAIFSVLQFGTIIPPLSPWTNVSRLKPGYSYKKTETGVTCLGANQISDLFEWPESLDQQADAIVSIIDKSIRNVEAPVILFSGGVDSGLIAARAAALGKRKSLLLNYSFGKDDSESQLAEKMAHILGLRFERIEAGSEAITTCLDQPGRIYPSPFGDNSVVPTSALARAVVERVGRGTQIFDGTGADGGFGMTSKIAAWKRLASIPKFARRVAGSLYKQFWTSENSSMEYRLRILRRSTMMELLPAILAQSPLAGILFDASPALEVEQLLVDWIASWAGTKLPRQAVACDLAMTCANCFAQKAQSIFDAAGVTVSYPFMTNGSLQLALTASEHVIEPKAPLKHALARHVPREMVYRPKSGFLDPKASIFHNHQFIEYLLDASNKGPLADILDGPNLRKVADLLSTRRHLPSQTLTTLWAIVFLHRWIATLPKK